MTVDGVRLEAKAGMVMSFDALGRSTDLQADERTDDVSKRRRNLCPPFR